MSSVLDGIRVLDFGRFIAAPYCAALLADLGAEVIRVDREGGNDDRWLAPITDKGDGATFLALNRNKKGICLDITTEQGRKTFHRLLLTADVVLTNMTGEMLTQLGLDYETLIKVKPDIIVTNVSTFGSIGRHRDRVGFDTMAQAMSGAMHFTGDGITPAREGFPFADFGTALYATIGTLAAILEKKSSGKGQKVEASLLHTALAFGAGYLIEQTIRKPNHKAILNRSLVAAPYDCYKAKDGWVFVAVIGNGMFKRWCRAVGHPALFDDPRFVSDESRCENYQPLTEIMQPWSAARTVAEMIAELDKHRIPCAPVYSLQQVLDDEHINEEAFLEPIDHPGVKEPFPVVAPPFRLSRTPAVIRRRPPLLDEHTEEILSEIRSLNPKGKGAIKA